MSIMEQMKLAENFSETEKQILQYLMQNPDKIETVTIQELARQTYSSNATIIRFCHKLGFKGYRDFRVALVRELENQKLIVNTVDYSAPFKKEEPISVVMQNMYSLFKECMDIMHTSLDAQVLQQMALLMKHSQRTFFFGHGDTELTIRSFINKCVKINFFPILATENYEHPYICQNVMTDQDCAFFISYSGNSGRLKDFEQSVACLRRKRVKIMVMTASPESYIAKHADYCICIPDLEKEAKIATFYSQMAFQYILTLLYSLLYRLSG